MSINDVYGLCVVFDERLFVATVKDQNGNCVALLVYTDNEQWEIFYCYDMGYIDNVNSIINVLNGATTC